MLLLVVVAVVSLVVGAYSHKWLAKETGAPANLTPSNVVSAAKAAEQSVAKKL